MDFLKGIFGPTSTSTMPVISEEMPAVEQMPNSNKTVLAPRSIENFRQRNAPQLPSTQVSQTTAPLARVNNNSAVPPTQSGGRHMRSKSRNLRPSLFLKYKYKMARRSMTMRKRCKKCGRKTCRGCKGTRKGSRRARR